MTWAKLQSDAWTFLSPSNKDVEKVRQIRNELERRGRHPLRFFLRCLEDDTTRDHSNVKKSASVPHEVERAKRGFLSAHLPVMCAAR
jgi:hypothetical protein